jgi:hypothetical protein
MPLQTPLHTGAAHNNLRISRILKHLSEMGLEHLNAGFVLHVLNEQSEYEELVTRMLLGSMDRWWANCIRNENERRSIALIVRRVRSEDGFVFTRDMYEAALRRRQSGQDLFADEQGIATND